VSGKERGRKSPPSGLSPEEKLLWAEAMRDAKTLSPGKRPAPEKLPDAPAAAASAPRSPRPPAQPVTAHPPAKKTKAKPPLTSGAVVDVDRRTAERLKRGQMPVEATLDLHGHTRAEAHGELNAFLDQSHAAGRRCVLIVTGKGARQTGGGVLRAEVPKWLNEAPNRVRILAFAGARPQHGGGGALYVLLRRRRGE
jgi:DNA-nicking Smr family endonuclease